MEKNGLGVQDVDESNDESVVDFDRPDDPMHPRNWPRGGARLLTSTKSEVPSVETSVETPNSSAVDLVAELKILLAMVTLRVMMPLVMV